MTRITWCIALVPLVGCVGVHVQPLARLPLAAPRPLDPAQQSEARVLFYPFDDDRGDEFSRDFATANIPVVSLLHSGGTRRYPELGLSDEGRRGATVYVGELTTALPSLLADTARRTRLTPNAAALTELGPRVDPNEADYIVTGRIRETRLDTHESVLLGAVLGLLGVPHYYGRLDVAYEVSLYRSSDRVTPLWRRLYRVSDRRVGGLYYNHGLATPMLTRALERSLPEVIAELAAALPHEESVAQAPPRPALGAL
jgi:hypothetical protein